MRSFAEAWPSKHIVQTLSGQLSWSHNVTLLAKLKDNGVRERYSKAAIEQGWSRNLLVAQIEQA